VRRRPPARPAETGRGHRLLLLLGAVALGVGLLASPAVAAPATTAEPPAAPAVTPSTTGPVGVGTPMTMRVAPGSSSDRVYGYAWTWQSASGAPTYSTLPSCGSDEASGGVHFVCGSAVTLRVSPEEPPFARFTVWAFDATGNRSAPTTTSVNATTDGTALYAVTHQWTTDQYWTVPPPATCGVGPVSLRCVPDTAGVNSLHPNGASPLLLPPGVTWDGSGSGVPGTLTFGPADRLPAGTLGTVVDPRQSFSAGAWLTPTAAAAATAETAVAEGLGRTGFELGLGPDGRWQFRVRSASGSATAVAAGTAGVGIPVYVSGVWDAVNREVRLYLNGTLASVTGFAAHGGPAAVGGVTVGARPARSGMSEGWTGQVGNPVVSQATLTSGQIRQLSDESFFPGGDSGLG
jgi:hypothetical protein